MAIPTSRTKLPAEIVIASEICTGCGRCVNICKDMCIVIESGKAKASPKSRFGCFGCGQCMAICPTNAIQVSGRTLSPEQVYLLPPKSEVIGYEQLITLYRRRRSIRDFEDQPISNELIDKIVQAAVTAPMGIPPSDVNLLIFDTKEKNHAFAKDFCNYIKDMTMFLSPLSLFFMKPFISKEQHEMFRNFVSPLVKSYINGMEKDINLVTYDAPLAIYFYGTPYSDPADPVIASTYAMTAAESLGLSTCFIGAVHPMIQNGKKAKIFRESHGIKCAGSAGIMVIFGYPAVHYHKGIKRTFASVVRV